MRPARPPGPGPARPASRPHSPRSWQRRPTSLRPARGHTVRSVPRAGQSPRRRRGWVPARASGPRSSSHCRQPVEAAPRPPTGPGRRPGVGGLLGRGLGPVAGPGGQPRAWGGAWGGTRAQLVVGDPARWWNTGRGARRRLPSSSPSPTSISRPNCWRQWCAPLSVLLVPLSAALRVVGKHNHVDKGMSSTSPRDSVRGTLRDDRWGPPSKSMAAALPGPSQQAVGESRGEPRGEPAVGAHALRRPAPTCPPPPGERGRRESAVAGHAP